MAQTLTAPPPLKIRTPISRFETRRTIVFREILTMSLDSLRADKVRAAMTALGMAVGTAALILVVTIALTGKSYVLAQIEAVGTNVIWAEYAGVSSAATSTSAADDLTINDMIAAEQQVPGIKEASPVLNLHQRMARGRRQGAGHPGARRRPRIQDGAAHGRQRRQVLRPAGRAIRQQGRADDRKPGAHAIRLARSRPGPDHQDQRGALRHHRHLPRERRHPGPLRD